MNYPILIYPIDGIYTDASYAIDLGKLKKKLDK